MAETIEFCLETLSSSKLLTCIAGGGTTGGSFRLGCSFSSFIFLLLELFLGDTGLESPASINLSARLFFFFFFFDFVAAFFSIFSVGCSGTPLSIMAFILIRPMFRHGGED